MRWCAMDRWHYARDVDVHVQPPLKLIIVARIDRLADLPRDALTAASILGRRFSAELLALIMEEGAEVPTALDDLRQARPGSTRVRSIGERVRVQARMIQEAAYGTLLLKRRRQLHRRAADALEALEGAPRVNWRSTSKARANLRAPSTVGCAQPAAAMRVSALVEAARASDIADALHAEIPTARDDVAVVELHLLRGRSGSPGTSQVGWLISKRR